MKFNRMLISTLLVAAFVIVPISQARAASMATTGDIASVRAHALAGIDMRINKLKEFVAKVEPKKLGGGDKTPVLASANAAISSLTSSRAKISADTDLATIQSDFENAVAVFRATRNFDIQGVMGLKAEGMEHRTDRGVEISKEFETAIASLKAQGKSVATLETTLASMKTHLEEADIAYETAVDMISGMVASSTDSESKLLGDKATLESAGKLVRSGGEHLRQANAAMHTIRAGLKSFGVKINHK